MLDVIVRIIRKGMNAEMAVVRLPDITEEDEGKILMVKNGLPAWGKMPIQYIESKSNTPDEIVVLNLHKA